MSTIRVSWETANGQASGEFSMPLPPGWDAWPTQARDNYLADLENETFFEISTVTAEVLTDASPAETGAQS